MEKRLVEYGLRNATEIITQTRDQAALLQQHYGREADHLIRNFHPDPGAGEAKPERAKVLWAANLKDVKRPELFVELAGRLAHLDAEFVMVGRPYTDAEKRARFEAMVAATPNLEYRGVVPQDEVNALLCAAHLFVSTSTLEGFPNTFIQSWHRSVPVLSLDLDPDGLIESEQLGVNAPDLDALTAATERLLRDPAERQRLGDNARAFAVEAFSLRNAERLCDIFTTLGGARPELITRPST